MADGEPKEPLAKLGGWLAGGQAVLFGALAALGIASGEVQRILRNSPDEAALWLGFIAVGILSGVLVANTTSATMRMNPFHLAVGVAGGALLTIGSIWNFLGFPTIPTQESGWRWIFLILGALLLLVGVVAAVLWWIRAKPTSREAQEALTQKDLERYEFFNLSWSGLLVVAGPLIAGGMLLRYPTLRTLTSAVGIAGLVTAVALAATAHQPVHKDKPKEQEPEKHYVYFGVVPAEEKPSEKPPGSSEPPS